jgi:hypothetical protein
MGIYIVSSPEILSSQLSLQHTGAEIRIKCPPQVVTSFSLLYSEDITTNWYGLDQSHGKVSCGTAMTRLIRGNLAT